MQAEPERVGRFTYTPTSGQWWWSDSLFALHGFSRGDVVPSSELLAAHLHPDDRDRVEALLDACGRDGRPVACQFRFVDAAGRERWAVLTAEGREPDTGPGPVVAGTVVDVTERQQAAAAERASAMIRESAASRAGIEQAKGVLALTYGKDPEAAFELLRWCSQRANVPVRDLATRLVEAASAGLQGSDDARRALDERFAHLATGGSRRPPARPPTPLHVEQRAVRGAQVLCLHGDVDLAAAPSLVTALDDALAGTRPPAPVVVDLGGAQHLGAAGVTALAAAWRRGQANGTPVRFVVPSTGTMSTLPAGVEQYEDLEAALRG